MGEGVVEEVDDRPDVSGESAGALSQLFQPELFFYKPPRARRACRRQAEHAEASADRLHRPVARYVGARPPIVDDAESRAHHQPIGRTHRTRSLLEACPKTKEARGESMRTLGEFNKR